MNAELEAIKDSWDESTGQGRDDATTRALCDAYVAAHPEEFAELEGKTLEEVVNALSVFRNAGLEEEQWRCEIWQLHHWEPQNIGGTYQAQVRLV